MSTYTITVPPSQLDSAVKTLWRKLRIERRGSDLVHHGVVIGRFVIADEATYWREFAATKIRSLQTVDFPDAESFTTALTALQAHGHDVVGNPVQRRITIQPDVYVPKKRGDGPRPRKLDVPEYLGIERDGVSLEVERDSGADYVRVSIARGNERYLVRFYTTFNVAVIHADRRETSRRLIIAPTVDDETVFTAEPREGERWVHGRLWFSNGQRWYDALTGVGIAPHQPEDKVVAERLGKLKTYPPIPDLIASHFRLWGVK